MARLSSQEISWLNFLSCGNFLIQPMSRIYKFPLPSLPPSLLDLYTFPCNFAIFASFIPVFKNVSNLLFLHINQPFSLHVSTWINHREHQDKKFPEWTISQCKTYGLIGNLSTVLWNPLFSLHSFLTYGIRIFSIYLLRENSFYFSYPTFYSPFLVWLKILEFKWDDMYGDFSWPESF